MVANGVPRQLARHAASYSSPSTREVMTKNPGAAARAAAKLARWATNSEDPPSARLRRDQQRGLRSATMFDDCRRQSAFTAFACGSLHRIVERALVFDLRQFKQIVQKSPTFAPTTSSANRRSAMLGAHRPRS